MEVALDYALQCSPDHPWVAEHPEWFHHRPDGTIAYAENPPKKYQDIYPINFWPDRGTTGWRCGTACREILEYWIARGVRIFRVDNPHTKPIAFWEWLIAAVQAEHPDVIFLAEAFTRPKVMAKLAEVGFTQSYTYFTWRTEQHGPEGLRAYLDELAPAAWPTSCGPTSGPTRPTSSPGRCATGPPPAFALRLVLAATMAPSYGDLQRATSCTRTNRPREPTRSTSHSEKYELRVPRLRPSPARSGPDDRPAQRDPPAPSGAAAAARRRSSTTATTRRSSPTPRPATTATMSCWWW